LDIVNGFGSRFDCFVWKTPTFCPITYVTPAAIKLYTNTTWGTCTTYIDV
jgi:hypothetical protein